MPNAFDSALDAAIAAITAPGGPLPVQRASIGGVDYPLFANAPTSLRDFLVHFLGLHGEKEFLVDGPQRWRFADVAQRGAQVAAMLQAGYGIAKGDRVAIAMRNSAEWVALFIGAVMAGAVVVPLNSWWGPAELAHGLADSGARLLFADEKRLRRVADIPGQTVARIAVRTSPAVAGSLAAVTLEQALADAADASFHPPPLQPEDDATILYTSGSTGAPKGAVGTHRAIVSATFNYLAQGMALRQLAAAQGLAPSPPVLLLSLPLFHITGLVPVLLLSIAIGRKLIVMRRWDAGEALRLIEAERCTAFIGVPTMSLELMRHPERARFDLSSLKDIAAGGAARPAAHVAQLAAAFPDAQPAIGYGLTETGGVGAGNARGNYLARPDSTGRPTKPLVEMMIADDAGEPLPAGETGEICIRSVANARGYWNQPAATAAAFTADGWFRTGDLGWMDAESYLTIVDRRKDIIIRGGENVSAAEVEAAIHAHPAVAEAAVFALPDEKWGEIVGAVVRPQPGEALERETLIGVISHELAPFKRPERLWIVAEPLPKLGSGKIDKQALRARYRSGPAA